MTIIFSKSCEYGIQAILYLAKKNSPKPVLLREISDTLDIPYYFTSKVLKSLTRDGITNSYKGATGGYELGRKANKIMLIEIVHAIDGRKFLDECVLGFPGCNDKHHCPVHNNWKKAKKIINDILTKKSVMYLAKDMDTKLKFIQSQKK